MTLRSQTRSALVSRPVPGRGAFAPGLVQRRIGQFSHHIETALGQQILPRLGDRRFAPDQAEIERLTALAAAGDRQSLSQAVNQKRRSGESSEQVCLSTLTEVARRLGAWWEEDRCGFVEVTLGMVVLHQLLRDLAPELRRGVIGHHARSALMLPMPGEQHSFGISMVAEFFRAAGWQVAQDGARSLRGLTRRVSQDWFGVVALSCGVVERLDALPAMVAAIRAHSFNPYVAIMVGGQAVAGDPRAAAACGADATATDAAEALRQAELLVSLMAAQP
jgi:methanogenic corrinoid protein MtbC1